MSFYKDKRKAYQIIDDMHKNGQSPQAIALKIQTLFGFGERIVMERINLREQIRTENERKPVAK